MDSWQSSEGKRGVRRRSHSTRMEQLPTELIAHIMKFLIPEVNPFLKFTTQGVHSSHLHPASFSSSTTSSSSSSAPAVVFPSSSSAALTSPRRSFLPSLHLLPHLHCKSRSSSWPSRGDGSGGGRGKKRGKNSKNQRWWDDWQSLRLVCKNWNVIATDPRLIIHIRRHQEVFFAQIAEQAKRYSGISPPPNHAEPNAFVCLHDACRRLSGTLAAPIALCWTRTLSAY